MDAFKKLLDFYKAQDIKDPVALATYVTRRYGTMDKFAMARGMAGKSEAKNWNPVKNTATGGKKSGKSAGKTVQGKFPKTTNQMDKKTGQEKKMKTGYKGKKGEGKTAVSGGTRSKQGGYGTRDSWENKPNKQSGGYGGKSLDVDKAQAIEDTRELADHLSGPSAKRPKGGPKTLWHGSKAGARSWHEFEGGIRSKDNAKEWNKEVGPPGSTYKKDGYRERPDKKKKEQPRMSGKYAGRAGPPEKKPSERTGEVYQNPRLFKDSSVAKKSLDILTKGFKFGGKPLKWDDLPRDPISFATNVMQDKGYKYTNLSAGSKGAKMRNNLSQGIRGLIRDIPEASKKHIKAGEKEDNLDKKEAKRMAEDMKDSWEDGKIDKSTMPITNPSISYAPTGRNTKRGSSGKQGEIYQGKTINDDNKLLEKISPGLARLMGAAAGWALSDSIVEAGGGSPRGQMSPAQQREWERLVRNSMRRGRGLTKEHMDNLRGHWDDLSDTYVRRVPINNSLNVRKEVILSKDHLPIPPRQGLMFDPVKHRWTSPDKLGKTVTEVQGKKRIRGSGTGVHEHSLKAGRIGGKGVGASAEAGRRFRGATDVGVQHPHETSNPSLRMTEHRKKLHRQVISHEKRKKSAAEKSHEAAAKIHASIVRSKLHTKQSSNGNGTSSNRAKALSRTHKLLVRKPTKAKPTKSISRR